MLFTFHLLKKSDHRFHSTILILFQALYLILIDIVRVCVHNQLLLYTKLYLKTWFISNNYSFIFFMYIIFKLLLINYHYPSVGIIIFVFYLANFYLF